MQFDSHRPLQSTVDAVEFMGHTIFGFSAGGVSVHSLFVSPLARGLFQKAIVESGLARPLLTATPMSSDGGDPNYLVSAETIRQGSEAVKTHTTRQSPKSRRPHLYPTGPNTRSYSA